MFHLHHFLFKNSIRLCVKVIKEKEQELSFTIVRRRSTKRSGESLRDLNDADDICLLSDHTKQAQALLSRVELGCPSWPQAISKETFNISQVRKLPSWEHCLAIGLLGGKAEGRGPAQF